MQDSLIFYEDMTIYEILDFVSEIKYNRKYTQEINQFLDDFQLFQERNRLIKKLSLGMKKKLSIIMALIGNPELIVLDEPTNGIDTLGLMMLKKNLGFLSKNGSIVILTSHVLDFVESICTGVCEQSCYNKSD